MKKAIIKPSRAILIICVIAFGARVVAVVGLQAWAHPNAIEHRSLAVNLLEGNGFSFNSMGYAGLSSVQSPTYPTLLAGLFAGFGAESSAAYIAAMMINALAGALTVYLVYRVVGVWGGAPEIQLTAAALCAIWPSQLYAVTHVQAISLITAALALMVLLFNRSVQTGRVGVWVGFSVVGCLAALTEPVFLPPMVLIGFLILVWPAKLTRKQRFGRAAILLVAGLSILGPWTLRNTYVHGKIVPVKSTFWVNLWKANNPNATGTDRLPLTDHQKMELGSRPMMAAGQLARDPGFDVRRQYDFLTDDQKGQLYGKSEVEREAVFQGITLPWIKENPGRYLDLCLIRLGKTLWIDWDNPKSHNMIYVISRSLMLLLGAIGLWIAILRRWPLGFLGLVAFCALSLYTLTITAARFSLPFEPLTFGFVALTVVGAYKYACCLFESGFGFRKNEGLNQDIGS